MEGMNETPSVRHNAADHRYEIAIDGHLAVAEYEIEGDRQIMTRTFVPTELRGRGLAEVLVRTALQDAQAAGRRVVPACSYVDKFMQRHEEFAALRA